MTTEDKKLRALPANLGDMDLTGLQNLHSEMLATCSDLGFEAPPETLVEITGVEQGIGVTTALHQAIRDHLDNPPLEDDSISGDGPKKDLAADEGASDTAGSAEKPAPKKKRDKKAKTDETVQQRMDRQKKARLARDAAKPAEATPAAAQKSKEKTVAKKAKKAAKKAAKKSGGGARPKIDETKKLVWSLKGDGNGARKDSERWQRREALRKAATAGKTVGAYLKAGGSVATLNRAVADKAVRLA